MPDALHLACSLVGEIPRGFELWRTIQFNYDNRPQQHVEAIYGSFDFIGPTRTSWKTSNRKWRNCRKIVVALNDSWNKTSTFRIDYTTVFMKFILFQSQKSPRQFHNCTFAQIGNYSLILTFFLSLFFGEVPTFIAPSYPVIIEVRPTKILFSRLLPFIYGENLWGGGGGFSLLPRSWYKKS